jgi:hypothetical protein
LQTINLKYAEWRCPFVGSHADLAKPRPILDSVTDPKRLVATHNVVPGKYLLLWHGNIISAAQPAQLLQTRLQKLWTKNS